jgi:hypothetical protein
VGLREGFRSGLEDEIAQQLRDQGIDPQYEQFKIAFIQPARNAKYTPDFRLPNGIIIETKGRFITEDRQKHLLIKAQHPELDIRFVFSNSRAYMTTQKNKEFVEWLKKHKGLPKAAKAVPKACEKYRNEFWETLKRKPSQTTYADWCLKHGFRFADKRIPQEWIDE